MISGAPPPGSWLDIDPSRCQGRGLESHRAARIAARHLQVPRHDIAPSTFKTLDLGPAWLETLDHIGYTQMTPIQAAALPLLLEGRDLIGHAETGTGKTAAFGLALLQHIEPASQLPGALVLCPTRELAEQVAGELRRLAWALPNTNVVTLCGGRPVYDERVTLEHGVDVVVGTPGRVLDHLKREHLDLSNVATVVLDEADRMLDMGFIDDVSQIVGPLRRSARRC